MAKVLLDLTDHGLNLLAIAQVAPHPQAASPVGFDFLRHAVNATPLPPDFSWRQILWRPLYVRKRNVGTLCCQFERRRATDAPHTPSARNQGHFALQSSHATPPLVPFFAVSMAPSIREKRGYVISHGYERVVRSSVLWDGVHERTGATTEFLYNKTTRPYVAPTTFAM